MTKPLTVANVQSQKISRLKLTGQFYEAFGRPQDRGFWFTWGNSASGKSSFHMQIAYELAKTKKVLYNVLEEEPSDSDYIERTELFHMQDVESNFHTASYNIQQLEEYLDGQQRNKTKVVVVDSLPYLTKSWDDYMRLKKKYAKTKIFIMVGHAKGSNPASDFLERVMYDAKMKIHINGYMATCKGRTIGRNGGQFIIWKEGYEKLNGINSSSNENQDNLKMHTSTN